MYARICSFAFRKSGFRGRHCCIWVSAGSGKGGSNQKKRWLAALLLVPLPRIRALVPPFRLAPAAAHERVVPAADAEASELSSGRSDRTHEPLVIGEWWWLASARCRCPGLLGA